MPRLAKVMPNCVADNAASSRLGRRQRELYPPPAGLGHGLELTRTDFDECKFRSHEESVGCHQPEDNDHLKSDTEK